MYDFLMPPVNLLGPGTAKEAGKRCKLLGAKKALVVTDDGMVKSGILDEVKGYIEKEGVETVVFKDVEPNPKDKDVEAGLKVYQDENCDTIVTLGGGSAHDCGKGIGIVATHPKKITEYAGIETLENALPPIVSINTTAGTASEVTRHCVITNTDTDVKFVVVSWRNLPSVSINDPELMTSKPPALTAATGMDALTHALETYVSLGANPVTDAQAIQSMKLVSDWLRTAVYEGNNIEARENMAYASLLAGMAFNNGGLGYVHAMAHQLGGLLDMPHGVANAVLLPHVERFNLSAKPERFADIAQIFGEDITGLSTRAAAEKAIEAIEQLSKDIGIPSGLAELNVDKKHFDKMAEAALQDGNAFTNPIQGTKEDVVKIFENAM
ncbi:iron-containing alcohol dehydrogenase [Natranaerofaba carboxydovora]|uniref:iron-containing alcohol dehydrogenase n=1 Tax=Natranaerofaba carboxydovora TaxID=2742683 RepID=UPI001F136085|nr:iron-containing alcohol dehydrogenase [Natranaerofaba carboxydovora]UMZ72680.1 1,3-propanediol dehydrogenase [Natranaerofaba carboxydovora]